jgi:hypothetical protein
VPDPARQRPSRETLVGVAATALAVAAMAVDHLLGDDPGLEDPPAFGSTGAYASVAVDKLR